MGLLVLLSTLNQQIQYATPETQHRTPGHQDGVVDAALSRHLSGQSRINNNNCLSLVYLALLEAAPLWSNGH